MPLVFVPTPLGNLRDITVRALDTLREAALIVAEDTRVARRLLNALEIGPKELWSYREQNAQSVTAGILARAQEQVVAVVTDAGMPGVSDPGSELIAAARAHGVAIDVLPGPSAVLGVAVLSGFPLRRFAFEGFPPRKNGARNQAFAAALRSGMTTIWFESPERIVETLASLDALDPGAQVFLVREYTKRFEQQLLGTPRAVAAQLEVPVRGEIAFAIAAQAVADDRPEPTSAEIDVEIDALLDKGRSVSAIAKQLAEAGLGERRDLYTQASARKQHRGMGNGTGSEKCKPL